ncbi:MAG: ABC transporter permease [Actinomycetales bacterium]|nr:ABC transporter permease [Actinomycetales bacterium]
MTVQAVGAGQAPRRWRATPLHQLVGWELLKIRTTRMWWGLLTAGVAMALFQSIFTAALAGRSVGGQPSGLPAPDDPAVLRTLYASGFLGGYVFVLVLGVLGLAAEYRHQTITHTFLAVPRRPRIVLAKLLAYLLAGAGFGAVLVATGVVAGGIVILLRGYPLGLDAPGVPRTIGLSVLGCAVWTIVGLGVGILIRNQVAAIVVSVLVAYLVDPLLSFGLNQVEGGGDVARYLPSQASAAIAEGPTSGTFAVDLLPWWGGLLVLCGYGLVCAAAGTLLTLRRDVS